MGEGLQAFILGVIEGLTEFLPVSSTGHMIIAMPLLGVNAEEPLWKVFLYFIQIGAIAAVVLYFWRRLWRQLFVAGPGGWRQHVVTKIAVGAVPGAIAGLTLDDLMERYLERPVPVACALVAGAVLMVLIERRFRRPTPMRIEDVTLGQAVFVGLAQCLSIIPGTSRAMVTIMAGIASGMSPAVAAEFSFYLAIPTLCGAGLLRLAKHRADIQPDMVATLGLGFSVSFVVALLVVAVFMRYIQTKSLWPFAVYRVILGLAVLVWWWSGI